MKKAMLVLISVVLLGVGSPTAFSQDTSTNASDEAQVNLNTATVEQLVELPGIGQAVAARIVAYRETNGSFGKIEELMNVRGIGEKTFLRLRPLIFVEQGKK
ncbi:MAG TPA: helix-hairpin-helix domain-containing protein [Vicinamibacteria bacterium]